MKILALIAQRKSGKSTAADLFVSAAHDCGCEFSRVAFANVLRKEFAEEKGIEFEILTDNTLKEKYRLEIIQFATEKKRVDKLYFINKLFETVQGNIVIDDMRFIEELAAVTKRGGITYKISCTEVVRQSRGYVYTPDIDDDLSETELGRDCSVDTLRVLGGGVVYNNTSEEDLRKEMELVFKKHFVGKL